MSELLLYLLAAAVLQNFVLTTGFGVTGILRKTVRRLDAVWQMVCTLWFSLLVSFTMFGIDMLTEFADGLRFWRPLITLGALVVWYTVSGLVFHAVAPKRFARNHRSMELGAFNGVVIGVAVIANYQFRVSALGLIGLCVGAVLGYRLLAYLLAEGERRMKAADMPEAFGGLPARFLYLGLLGLALCGFASSVTLI